LFIILLYAYIAMIT